MKLLKLLENAIKENYTGVDIRMFALFADIFSDLVKGLKSGMLGEVYRDLSQKYEGTKKQLPLEYFYDFLTKNKEHFLKGEESLQEGDIKKETLFKYWDDKGIDAKPIYHYLNLDNQKEMDNHLIAQYKIEYFDGIENMIKILYDRLEIGKPFTHFSGGYEINAVITNVNLQMSDGDSVGDYSADYLRNGIYYEIDSVINGENSSVTLLTTGEDYMLDDLFINDGTGKFLGMGTVDEIGYEIGDVLRDYVDSKIIDVLGFKCDTVDWNVISEQEFKNM